MMLAMCLAGTPAFAQSRPLVDVDFRASGSEPFWSLTMDGRQITFSDNGEDTVVVQPRPSSARGTRRYIAPGLRITITPEVCMDEGERSYLSTVRVVTRGRTYDGCGGGILPPETLERTTWRITSINGETIAEDSGYSLDFNEGRLTGRAGCNMLAGAFNQTDERLTARLDPTTRMACAEPQAGHQRALATILASALISFPNAPNNDPPIMVLTGADGGRIWLQLI